MKTMKLCVAIFILMAFTTLSIAQDAAPKVPTKIDVIEQMANDLQLTPEQKMQASKLLKEKRTAIDAKMLTATTDEEKKALKQESALNYNKKLEETFGKELADKMIAWSKEFNKQNKPK